MVRLGVAGWPVAHSLSPVMQNAGLRAAGLGGGWRYQLLPLPPRLFAETVPELAARGFRGINVTIPHKSAALALASSATARARAMGAANTLVFSGDGAIIADNTDGPGMVAALAAAIPGGARGRRALVLGAGGSARSAVWSLLDGGAASVAVWNRTADRSAALCEELGAEAVSDPAALERVQVIVNCTAVGLRAEDTLDQLPLDERLIAAAEVVVDFVYRQGGTVLGEAARELGVPFIDGLELLVRQGTESFRQFTGLPAPEVAMRAALAPAPGQPI